MFCLHHVYTYTACVPKKVRRGLSAPLSLELWMLMNHPMGAGNQTQVLCKSNKCLKPIEPILQPCVKLLRAGRVALW